ncbi:MAG: CDP-alcohol phosphatidyltransferase family protein [Saprospiraceae bacterium]|nr:CDP-alcohol phosphatidyltransferase family protein [Saprospiraceae bacterium]
MGAIHCVFLAQGIWDYTFLLLGLCLLADLLDGLVARTLNQNSALGIQLDSLADVVSFGLVAGIMSYQLLLSHDIPGLAYLGFVLTLGAAFRLARFNLSTHLNSKHFDGLPVPAMAVFFAGLNPLANSNNSFNYYSYLGPIPMVILILVLTGWMISKFPVIKVEPKPQWVKNYPLLCFVILGCFLFVIMGYAIFMSVAIIFYSLYSLFKLNQVAQKSL